MGSLKTAMLPLLGAGLSAVHGFRKQEALPIRLGELELTVGLLKRSSYGDVLVDSFVANHAGECWTLLSVHYINLLHGCRSPPVGCWRKIDATAVSSVRAAVQRSLRLDSPAERSSESVEKELSSRFVSYTGEEVPKMEVLTKDQIAPALQPAEHGGSIDILDWTKGRTRSFLVNPSGCLASDEGQLLPKLQAKVHIAPNEKMSVASLLIERNICQWIELEEVISFRGDKVLNGMFGLAKGARLEDGRSHLRLIMNLIPSNSVFLQLTGCVQQLPAVTQYLSVMLEEGESLKMCQNDMTSAFYLFRYRRAGSVFGFQPSG